MKIYRKNSFVTTKEEAENLIAGMDDFVNNPIVGKQPPTLDHILMQIWNNGDHLEWEWSDESLQEYDQRIAGEQAEVDLLAFHKANLEAWKDVKIRPWRNAKYEEWINDVAMRPTKYKDITIDQAELDAKHEELRDFPNSFTEWVDDAAIDAAKPAAPSWISE